MKSILVILMFLSQAFASINNINTFEADFTQTITDEKNTVLAYGGHMLASKPQNVRWNYLKPVKKDIYISKFEVTIVEPEIEQVIFRKIESDFNFFRMIANAKEINKNTYEANYKNSKFKITKNGELIESISYVDEFENRVKIIFRNQKQNQKINESIFTPSYPLSFDIIRD